MSQIFMEKAKKFKLFIAIFYLVILSFFLTLLFSKFDLDEITSYKFIQSNLEYFLKFKETNFFITSFVFFALITVWVFMLGFGSPVALLGGLIFGKWYGTLIVVSGLSLGATFLYIFGIFFLKNFLEKNFSNKLKKLELSLKKNELIFLIIYRFIGGLPFQLGNLIPVLFNVKIINYLISTFVGIAPQIFIIASLGSGVEKIISQNETMPTFSDLIYSKEIYLPILFFIIILLVAILLKNYFYKK